MVSSALLANGGDVGKNSHRMSAGEGLRQYLSLNGEVTATVFIECLLHASLCSPRSFTLLGLFY